MWKLKTLVLISAIILISVFPMSTLCVFGGEVTEESQKQLALAFVEKVAGINLSRFTHDVFVGRPEPDYDVQIRISSEQGSVTAYVYLVNGNVWRFWYKPEVPPLWLWADAEGDILLAARRVLEQSQLVLNCSYHECAQFLGEVVPDRNQTLVRGNLTLHVENNGHKFAWVQTVGGIELMTLVSFQISGDGHLMSFGNTAQIISIGTTEVKISKAQAINIAVPQAQKYACEHWQKIAAIMADLRRTSHWSARRGDQYVVYLDWLVEVVFNRMNNKGMTRYFVQLAADTGQVLKSTPDGPVESYNSQGAETPINTLFTLAAVAIVASTTITSIAVYRRRHLKTTEGNSHLSKACLLSILEHRTTMSDPKKKNPQSSLLLLAC